MNPPSITLEELLAEIERVSVGGPSGFTVRELRDLTGYSEDRARSLIRRGIDAKILRPARKTITDIAGRPNFVPCYVPINS